MSRVPPAMSTRLGTTTRKGRIVPMPFVAMPSPFYHGRPVAGRDHFPFTDRPPCRYKRIRKTARKAHATGGPGGVAAGGGRSEVKRSRAGSPHGEPRTESPSEAAQPKGESRRRPSTGFALLGYPRSRK